ncbi:MAG TPA: c-type cytochrome domain-containing protein [Chitinophagales bacterium]|nr:c-type cytochrome domain-containing protein [Chitinophagales bacterium]
MKNQLKLFSIIIVLFFAAGTGCVWDKSAAPVPVNPIACDTTNVSYDSTIVGILQKNCYACHSSSLASGGVILTDYNGVLTVVNNGQLWNAINFSPGVVGMPLSGSKLSDCDIAMIGAWINAGAPAGGGGNTNEKDSVCYENEIQPILNSYCAKSGCHDAITHKEGYNLSDFSDVMSLVKPGNPGDSKLIKVMKKTDEDKMPPPGNAAPTADQITLIEKWISEGAKTGIDCNVGGCDTSNVTFSGSVVSILQINCYGCHSAPTPGGGVLLTSYNGVKTVVDNGKLWGAISFSQGYIGMPYNGSKMSDCNIAEIRIWIDGGALNN